MHQARSVVWNRSKFTMAAIFLSMGLGCHKVDSAPVASTSHAVSSDSGAEEAPWFIDITEKVGLHFVHDAGPLGNYFMPESLGSGAALFDFDNDGRLDIYLLQNGGPNSRSTNRLF